MQKYENSVIGEWLTNQNWSHWATLTTGYELTLNSARRAAHRFHDALDKSAPTIQRYLDENDIMLTTDAALTTIAKKLGIKKNTIVCCAVGDCSGCRTAADQEAYRNERDFLMNIELNS